MTTKKTTNGIGFRVDVADHAGTMGVMAPSEAGITLVEHYAAGEDIGMRRELVDGVLIVSPFASVRHALAAQRLNQVLVAACLSDLLVLGTINVDQEPATNVQPDLTVIRVADIDTPATVVRPLLVVEILSPSTRRFDETVKRQIYAEMCIASYWLVDITEPSIRVLELSQEGAYDEVLRLVGVDGGAVDRPFPVVLRPTDLLLSG